jgi:hypothetical protein
MDKEKPRLPTPLVRRFVSYVAGFGIAVGLGLSPFLGKISGVDALLEVFPRSLWTTLIPFSVFLMGILAIAVQFYSGEVIHRATIRRRFRWGVGGLLAGFALLIVFHDLLVVTVSFEGGKKTDPFLIGFTKTEGCGCAPTLSNAECIKHLSFDAAQIEACWNTGLSRPILQFSYLLLTGGFASLVGLLLLQMEARRQEKAASAKKRNRKSARKKRPTPPAAGAGDGASPHGTS